MKDTKQDLHELREKADNINASLINDLRPFFSSDGLVFRRLPDSDQKGNVTTTCSCLMALATSELLMDFFRGVPSPTGDEEARKRITNVFEKAVNGPWDSSGLPDPNPFSFLIVLRT